MFCLSKSIPARISMSNTYALSLTQDRWEAIVLYCIVYRHFSKYEHPCSLRAALHANTHTKANEFGVEEHESQANIEAFGISNFPSQKHSNRFEHSASKQEISLKSSDLNSSLSRPRIGTQEYGIRLRNYCSPSDPFLGLPITLHFTSN